MTLSIRAYAPSDFERVLDICIRAFTPVHEGFEQVLGAELFARQYPDWKGQYATDIAALVASGPATQVHVAEAHGMIVGFVTTTLHEANRMGEIGLNAVDPAHQGGGIGKAMYAFALADLKSRGAVYAYVGTGADAAHAPARAAYEAIGFDRMIPGAHYFRAL